MSETDDRKKFYPDLVQAGSLSGALDEELARGGSTLRSSPEFFGVRSATFAKVSLSDRHVQVLIASGHRSFNLGVWESGVEMASGWLSSDLSEAATMIRLVLENADRKISELIKDIPTLELGTFALSYERGSLTEDKWQELMGRWDRTSNEYPQPNLFTYLAELIRLASQRPNLRRLIPFTSLQYFSVSRKPPQEFDDLPMIQPLHDGTYVLTSPTVDRTPMGTASGTASVVLDALEEVIRERGIEPAAPRDA